ncbi:MAG: GMP synthase (glutamine-hydrolyzing) subunit A [Methanoregula sp. PtaU1.Bin051]|nr:MAG: GMP synthase (glutamine-hydrolyzing) subunit A [Methanoregula sp. PtaU1.Bin051]
MHKIRLTVFQQTRDEPMGYFDTLCREWNISSDCIRLFENNEARIPSATHLLILGGPMSVNDEKEYPYLADEKNAIRSFVKSGKPVLGICLGAQLLAAAFGGKVYPYKKEIGWYEIRSLGSGIFKGFPSSFWAFQMHGETFDLPPDGRILCSGENVQNQALQIGSATGLQFHPEMTSDLIRRWIKDLPSAERDRISNDTEIHLTDCHSLCRTLAERFFMSEITQKNLKKIIRPKKNVITTDTGGSI